MLKILLTALVTTFLVGCGDPVPFEPEGGFQEVCAYKLKSEWTEQHTKDLVIDKMAKADHDVMAIFIKKNDKRYDAYYCLWHSDGAKIYKGYDLETMKGLVSLDKHLYQ